ncbi:hypothetical protein HD597_012856 [Nonomuraea thailandensis]|uniref:Uncharacterized protein n=1 Tax=Nonomuraea thailandensis TaxID=1188745 RepID=A0A9X2K9G7_9ACTN|nr:hypothetical protein [Nonomuraea thailandensis]MCP2365752.1 hypothetical protein [Nonomuraea thailandensis]
MATTTAATATAQALAARIAADTATLRDLLNPDTEAFADFDGDYAAILGEIGPALVNIDDAVANIDRVVEGIADDAHSAHWDKAADAVAGAKEDIRWYGHDLTQAAEHARRGQEETQQQIAAVVQQATADTPLSPAPSPAATADTPVDRTDPAPDPMPTAYVVGWLQAPEVAHVRRYATTVAERALAADQPDAQWLYLLELRDIVHHPWKYPDHQEHADAREHVHQLHDTLTYDQLHSLDWHQVAQSLIA